MKINLGCASNPLFEYTNVDIDTLEDMKLRYPNKSFSDDLVIKQWDIFNLPVEDNSVDEVRADCLFEHLSFKEEKNIFHEVKRVLKVGGVLNLAVPDAESIVRSWMDAEDDWKDWYRDDDEAIKKKHWFGTYEYSYKNRWGYLTACFFGSQNGEGQYHKNFYTIGKLRNICKVLDLEIFHEELFNWSNSENLDKIIRIKAKK
jgi:predicted SAM-dependent methyltransferase